MNVRPLSGSRVLASNGDNWSAGPTGWFARPGWRVSAKADAHINGVECLELVDSGRSVVAREVTAARTAAFIDWTNLLDYLAARVTLA